MKGFWAKLGHGAAIAGQVAIANHAIIPHPAQPYIQVGLAITQLIIGIKQHRSNLDGTPAELPYRPEKKD